MKDSAEAIRKPVVRALHHEFEFESAHLFNRACSTSLN
jgi:hypothetical protein